MRKIEQQKKKAQDQIKYKKIEEEDQEFREHQKMNQLLRKQIQKDMKASRQVR